MQRAEAVVHKLIREWSLRYMFLPKLLQLLQCVADMAAVGFDKQFGSKISMHKERIPDKEGEWPDGLVERSVMKITHHAHHGGIDRSVWSAFIPDKSLAHGIL